VLPTVTLPKPRLGGLLLKSRLKPVPEKEMVVVEFEALVANETLPLALPVELGVNATLNVVI
jgi:hypothetical protein